MRPGASKHPKSASILKDGEFNVRTFLLNELKIYLIFVLLVYLPPPPPVTAMCVSNLLVCLLIFLEYVEARPYGRRFVDANNMKPLNQEGNPIDSSGRHARLHV